MQALCFPPQLSQQATRVLRKDQTLCIIKLAPNKYYKSPSFVNAEREFSFQALSTFA